MYLKLIMELQPYNMYLRALVPFMMIQLGKDDEAYNFIKFWYEIFFLEQPFLIDTKIGIQLSLQTKLLIEFIIMKQNIGSKINLQS